MMKMMMAAYDPERVQDAFIAGGSSDVMAMIPVERVLRIRDRISIMHRRL